MAVNTRTRTGWYIAPNLFMALAQAAPRPCRPSPGCPPPSPFTEWAPTGGSSTTISSRAEGRGRPARGDGKSGLLWPTSAGNTSIELFETRTPVLVLEKNYVADTGGPGRHRGGLGQIVRVRKLHDDGRPTLAGLHPDGVRTRTPGLFGGQVGGPVRGVTRSDSGDVVRDHGIGGLVTLTRPDEILEVQLAGGSGYGDPLDRTVDDVQRDLDHGYVSPEGAARDFGCVVGASGRIDPEATAALRALRPES